MYQVRVAEHGDGLRSEPAASLILLLYVLRVDLVERQLEGYQSKPGVFPLESGVLPLLKEGVVFEGICP